MSDGFVIKDMATNRRYVDVVYDTEESANTEMECLLLNYPKDHHWRKRLCVCPAPAANAYAKPKSAGGWRPKRYRDDELDERYQQLAGMLKK
jgi:hypothetical protein